MKVFVSWSKEPSKTVAFEVKHLVEMCVPGASAWMSEVDIGKGERWNGSVSKELGSTHVGIICCTNSNLMEPWIHFEAGALSKSIDSAQVHPLCFGIGKGDLPPTLGQFQATEWEKKDVLNLLLSIAERCENPPSSRSVEEKFGRAWDGFNTAVLGALKGAEKTAPGSSKSKNHLPEVINEDLAAEEILILQTLANFGERMVTSDIARIIEKNEVRTEHFLTVLTKRSLVHRFLNMVSGSSWGLTEDGRAFAVKMDWV